MKFLSSLSNLVGKYMAIITLVVAAIALFAPQLTSWVQTSWITTLLMIVMFGMGLTMTPQDFAIVFKNPRFVIIGFILQYTIMPTLAFIIGKALQLSPELLVGLVLVGTCPGGTSSNVMSYLAKADVALSVAMTSVSTLLAPIMTPAITWFALRSTVEVDAAAMFMSIIQVIIIPIGAGFIINHFFSKQTQQVADILPLISATAIVLIVAAVVTANSEQILSTGLVILVAVVLHNILGYFAGFGAAKLLRANTRTAKTIAIEVGMQNSGLATSLAIQAFPTMAMATVPGAVFSVWHNISGAILANIFSRIPNHDEKEQQELARAKANQEG